MHNGVIKLTFIGDSKTGKSTIITKLSNGTPQLYVPTIGVDFDTVVMKIDNTYTIKLKLWEIGGKVYSDNILKNYITKEGFYILFINLHDLKTLTELRKFIKYIPNFKKINILRKILFINQWDFDDIPHQNYVIIEQFIKKYNLISYPINIQKYQDIHQIFKDIITKYDNEGLLNQYQTLGMEINDEKESLLQENYKDTNKCICRII